MYIPVLIFGQVDDGALGVHQVEQMAVLRVAAIDDVYFLWLAKSDVFFNISFNLKQSIGVLT